MLFHTIFQQKCLFFSFIYSLLGILCHWPCVYKAEGQHSRGCSGLQGAGWGFRTQNSTRDRGAPRGERSRARSRQKMLHNLPTSQSSLN